MNPMINRIIYFIIRDDDNSDVVTIPLNISPTEEEVNKAFVKISTSKYIIDIEASHGTHEECSEGDFEIAFTVSGIPDWNDLQLDWEITLDRLGLV